MNAKNIDRLQQILHNISEVNHLLGLREVMTSYILPYLSLDYAVFLEVQSHNRAHRIIVEGGQEIKENQDLRTPRLLQYLSESLSLHQATPDSPLIKSIDEELSQLLDQTSIEKLLQAQVKHIFYASIGITHTYNVIFLGFSKMLDLDKRIATTHFRNILPALKEKLEKQLFLQHHETYWLLFQLEKALHLAKEEQDIIEYLNIYVQPILMYDIVTWDNVPHNGHSYTTYKIEKALPEDDSTSLPVTQLGITYQSPFYQQIIQRDEPLFLEDHQIKELNDPLIVKALSHDRKIRQLIAAAPRIENKPVGVLTFLYENTHVITQEKLTLVNSICEMMAQLTGRLYAEHLLDIRLEEKNVLQNIGKQINAANEPELLIQDILGYLESYLNFATSTITVISPDHKTYRVFGRKIDQTRNYPASVDSYLEGEVPVHPLYIAAFHTNKPQVVYVEEVEREMGEIDIIKVLKESNMVAYITSPLNVNGKTIGLLFLNYYDSATINDFQLQTLDVISKYLAFYIQGVMINELTRKLNTFAHTFSKTVIEKNLKVAMGLVEKNLQLVLQYDSFHARLSNNQLQGYYTHGLLPHLRENASIKTINKDHKETLQPLLWEIAAPEAMLHHASSQIYIFDYRALDDELIAKFPILKMEREAGISYGVVIPLQLDQQSFGEMIISSFGELDVLEKDFHVSRVLSNQVAQGLNNINLYHELISRQRNKEMELALNQDLQYADSWEDNFYYLSKHIRDLIDFSWCIFVFLDNENHQYYFGICKSLPREQIKIQTMPKWAKEFDISEKKLHSTLLEIAEHTTDNTYYNDVEFLLLTQKIKSVDILQNRWETLSLLRLGMDINDRGKLVICLGSQKKWGFDNRHISYITQWEKSIGIILAKHLAYSELKQRELAKSIQLGLTDILKERYNWPDRFTAITQAVRKYLNFDIAIFQLYLSFQDKLISYAITPIDKKESQVLDKAQITEILRLGKNDLEKAFTKLSPSKSYFAKGEELAEKIEKNPLLKQMYQVWKVQSLIYFPVYKEDIHFMNLIVASKDLDQLGPSDQQLITTLEPILQLLIRNMLSYDEIQVLHQQKKSEALYLQEEIHTQHNFEEIIGKSDAMKEVFELLTTVAPLNTTVLLQGETGTGKELFARALHNLSPRKEKPLIKVNCASLPPTLIESELFGHESDAFTGARKRRIGKFELANGGSIFLDEIGELPLDLQSKLLRVIQEQEIERIGGNETIRINVRIIAATNRNLTEEVQEGHFRSDLYFRLNVFPIELPPLRKRPEDIPLLAQHFVQKIAPRIGKKIEGIQEDSLQKMAQYSWPGNVREFEHVIERSIILNQDALLTVRLPLESGLDLSQTMAEQPKIKTLEEAQKEAILFALKESKGRVRGEGGAAELLNIHPSTLDSRIKKLGIEFQAEEKKG